MLSLSRKSHVRLPVEKLLTIKPLNPPLETWALVLVVVVTMILTIVALGACWDSLNTDQTMAPYQDRLNIGFVC